MTILNGTQAEVAFHFVGPAVPNGAVCTIGLLRGVGADTPAGVATEIRQALQAANVMGNITADVAVQRTVVKFGPTATGPTGEDTTVIAGSGPGVGEMPQVAFLFRKQTSAGGRAGRGRMYWPGVPATATDVTGVVNGDFRDDVQVTLDAFLAELDATSITPVVIHGPTSPIEGQTAITALVCDGRVATQRRRLRG